MAKETKLHILRGFSQLLSDNDFDKVTVTMLVEKCNISRQTFYYHFADIQALIDWGVKQYTLGCVEAAKNASDMKEATILYLNEIEKNKVFLKKCLSSSLSRYMTSLIRKSVIEYSSDFYTRSVKYANISSDIAQFIIEFTANGVTGFIISMLDNNEPTDVEAVADKMYNCIFKRLADYKQ